jgi:inhibitor of KinA
MGFVVRFLDAGEAALVVEFGDVIDPDLHNQVLALDATMAERLPPGVVECVPSYRSLMIHYDPLIIERDVLVGHVQTRLETASVLQRKPALWSVPVCYDQDFGEDLAVVADWAKTSIDDVVRLHSGARYRLYMVGFAPGWSYLGGLPKELAIPRRQSPRASIPAGSIIIAGGQAIIAGDAMPSGWHILGRTPERVFALDREPHYPFAIGDLIRFAPVDRRQYDDLLRQGAAGRLLAARIPP